MARGGALRAAGWRERPLWPHDAASSARPGSEGSEGREKEGASERASEGGSERERESERASERQREREREHARASEQGRAGSNPH